MTNKDKSIQKLQNELANLKKQITRLKEADSAWRERQRDLEKSETKLQLFLKSTPARIINIDLNGNILYINHTTTRRAVREVLGKNVYDSLSPEEQKRLKQILSAVIKTGKKIQLMALLYINYQLMTTKETLLLIIFPI